MPKHDAIINPQHNRQNNVPKAEPRSLLCCNTDVNRGSALGSEDEASTELLINELANMIVEAYFYHKDNEK